EDRRRLEKERRNDGVADRESGHTRQQEGEQQPRGPGHVQPLLQRVRDRAQVEREEDRNEEQEQDLCDAVEEQQQERSEEHTSELQSRENLVCRLLLEKKKKKK